MSKIGSWFALVIAFGLIFYPMFWWISRPELTQMQIFLEWWVFMGQP